MSSPAHPSVELRVHLTLLAVQGIFAVFHVVGKALLADLHPLVVAGYRVSFAVPALLALAWWKDRRLPALSDLPHLALLGLLGTFANQLLFLFGLTRTSATNSAILMPSIPIFAVALGALFGIERLNRRRVFGIGLCVAGALVLLDPTRMTGGESTRVGNLLILANCLSFAAFLVFQRPLLRRLPWRTVIAWTYVFGGTGILAVSASRLADTDPAAFSPGTWLGLAYMGLAGSALAYLLNTWAVQRSSPNVVAAYTTVQPLATSLLAFFLLGETVGWRQAAGLALILGGLVGISYSAGSAKPDSTSTLRETKPPARPAPRWPAPPEPPAGRG